MKKIYNAKSQGVTIIELTIVIALLSIISAIFFLSYEFFIRKYKVTKIAIDAKEYTRTLESFHLVYGGLPGDLASANKRISANLIDGDGDGRIQNETEQFQVWPHLSESKMLEQKFQNLATNATPTLGVNLPVIRNSDNLAIGVVYNTPSGYRANSFIIGGLNGRDVSRPVLTQGDIHIGDQKYDDNNPTGGSWMCGKNPPNPSDCNYNNPALDGENFMLYLPITRTLASGSSSSSCPAQSLQIGQLVANIPEIQPASTYTGNCRGINANYAGTYQIKCSQQTSGQYSVEILSNSCTLKICTNIYTTTNITDSTSVQTGNVVVGNNLVYSCNSPKVPKQVKCVASLTDDTASFDTTPSCIDSTTIGTVGNIPIYQTDVLFKDSGKKFNDIGSTNNDILTASKVYELLGKTTIENNYITKFDASNNKLLQGMLFDNASTIGMRSNESTIWSATPPNAKALLEMRSTVQGFLPPRMTEQQRNNLVSSLTTTDKTALAGLVVFNTDSGKLQVWDGKAWSAEQALETVPIGTIVAWSKSDTNSIPSGWLLLNGQSVLVSSYQDLANAFPNWVSGLNINLPDFRGYFLRGYGTNTDGTTSGAGTFFGKQSFATANPTNPFTTNITGAHTHTFQGYARTNYDPDADIFQSNVSGIDSGGGSYGTSSAGDHSHFIAGGGDSETRPKNIAVHYIIKAKAVSMSDNNIQAIVQSLMGNVIVGNRVVKFNSDGTRFVTTVINEKDNGDSTVSIGVNTDTPNAKALLELKSSAKGFLPPRMTQTQRDAILPSVSEVGMTVYNTTSGYLEVWNGSSWSGNFWSKTDSTDKTTNPTADIKYGNDITVNGILVGKGSGNSINGDSVAVGISTLKNNTSGYSNVAIGFNSLQSNTTGYANTATGLRSIYSNTTGNSNTAVGNLSLYSNTTGNYNTANGDNSLYSNTTGSDNTAIGKYSLTSNTTGVQNTAVGRDALFANTGNNNTAIGYLAGNAITTGSSNVVIGDSINPPIVTGSNQVAIGTNGVVKILVDSNGNTGLGTTTPSAKALLELKSSAKGFLPPRMTSTERDAIITSLNSETDPVAAKTALAGLIIYNQTSKVLETWNGSSWVSSGGSGIDTTPVGTIVAWSKSDTNSIPAGWLLLNGQTFTTSQYPDLAAIFPSGKLPDFRGYFLRGYGTNTNDGGVGATSSTFMSFQQDDFKSHKHDLTMTYHSSTGGGYNGGRIQLTDRTLSTVTNPGEMVMGNTGGSETRPKNIAVHYIIKAQALTLSASNVQQIVESISTFTPATSASSGQKGLVPTPAAGDNNAMLRGSGTWRKFIAGTVVIGDINSASIGTITGDITSASVISNNDDGYTIIQVNFPNMGSDSIINVTPESISSWAMDNDTSRVIIRNRTSTSVQIGLYETAGVVQNIRLHVMIMASS